MSLVLMDPEQWYDNYEAASAKQQYEMMMEALDQPLSTEAIEEIDLGMLVVDLRDELASNNRLDDFLAFVDKIKQKQPELYEQEYPYLDNLLVRYYLFRQEPELLQEALARYKANPVESIEELWLILDDLTYYGETEVLLEICRTTYEPVKNDPDSFGGAEDYMARITIAIRLEETYQRLKAGEEVDWEALADEAEGYGVSDRQKWLSKVKNDLTVENKVNERFLDDFNNEQERLELLRNLGANFSRYAIDQKQMPLITSQAIWNALTKMLEDRDLSQQQLSHPNSYFNFEQKEFDTYIVPKLGNFMLSMDVQVMGLLWGIPYVYGFLRSKEAIAQEIYDKAIAVTSELKAVVIEGLHGLWKYDFVHRWLPPDSISEADFAAEAEQFAASIGNAIPLSEEPGQGTLESLLAMADKNVPRELLEEFKRQTGRDLFKSVEIEPAPEPKREKPPKSRRSPLQEAAKMNAKKTKNKKKKKKR